MCGIAGILKIHDPNDGEPPHPLDAIPESWLDSLDEAITHRGPDGQGRFRDRAMRTDGTIVDIALVHRRLSIIDHAGGRQPMVHDTERLRDDLTYQPGDEPKLAHELAPGSPLVAVVFNGCIYNHRKLRQELEREGCTFQTDHSDTEMLLHGWRCWGSELPKRLDSMHAAGLWKRDDAEFALSRDLVGQKPVCALEGLRDSTVFASEAAALRSWIRRVSPHDNRISIEYDILTCDMENWLRFGWGFSTLMRGGQELSPNEWIDFRTAHHPELADPSAGNLPTPSFLIPTGALSMDDLPERGSYALDADTTAALIRGAVESCSDSDVPISLLLSGGVDSGLLAGIAGELGLDMTAVTIRMPDERYDESEAAAEIASHTGLRHQIVDCDPDPADDLISLIHSLGLPFADSSLLPTFWACQAAAEFGKVAIGGDGGDELFAGYMRHTVFRGRSWIRGLARLVPEWVLPSRDPTTRTSKLSRLLRASRHAGYPDLLSIFDSRLLTQLIGGTKATAGSVFAESTIDGPSYDFLYYLPEDLLRKSDTASMAMPIELRAPLLSRSIVTACLSTSLDVLMPGGERKGLLKQVARNYLPDRIVDRPKQGFAVPIGEWFRSDHGSMRTLLYDHLESRDPFPGLSDAGVSINMDFVGQMLREHDAAGEKSINPWHGRDHSQRLYLLLVLSIWSKWVAGLGGGEKSQVASSLN